MSHDEWRKSPKGQIVMFRCWLRCIEHAFVRGGLILNTVPKLKNMFPTLIFRTNK